LRAVGPRMPRQQEAFGELRCWLNACGFCLGCGGCGERCGAVGMASSAIQIDAADVGDRVVNAQAVGRPKLRDLQALRSPDVAAAHNDRRSRKLQRQECEHQQNQKGAHVLNFMRRVVQRLRARAISSANSGRTGKGSKALTVARPGLPSGKRPLKWPRGTKASLSTWPAASGQSRVRCARPALQRLRLSRLASAARG
jgi:hypothetical protein